MMEFNRIHFSDNSHDADSDYDRDRDREEERIEIPREDITMF